LGFALVALSALKRVLKPLQISAEADLHNQTLQRIYDLTFPLECGSLLPLSPDQACLTD
jgi:hypothetical protein